MRKVLVVIDMQNDFIDGALGTKEAIQILPNVVRKVTYAKEEGTDVIFTMDTHSTDYLNTNEGRKLPVEHCVKSTWGWNINELLQPYTEKVVEKGTFGSVELPCLVQGYDVIELVGLCTDICVISNALVLKANYPEKDIIVDSSCCAGVTPETHQNALDAMKMCHIDIA